MMKLDLLKTWYSRYEDFWSEWKHYKYCGLNRHDVRNIEMFRDHGFKIDIGMLEKFHTKDEIYQHLVTPLVDGLKLNYREYKEWVSLKFQISLVKYGSSYGVDTFFSLPIRSLPVNKDVKALLLLFECKNIDQLLERYKNGEYLKNEHFKKVVKFKQFISEATTRELYVLDEVLSKTSLN